MIKGFNHIGICVKSIDETFAFMEKAMGAKMLSKTEYADRKQVSAIIVLADGISKFELMEPIGNEGTVAKFLEKRGQGIHHISLSTSDMEKTCDDFSKAGAEIISKVQGLAFMNPKTCNGILYEISDGTFNKG